MIGFLHADINPASAEPHELRPTKYGSGSVTHHTTIRRSLSPGGCRISQHGKNAPPTLYMATAEPGRITCMLMDGVKTVFAGSHLTCAALSRSPCNMRPPNADAVAQRCQQISRRLGTGQATSPNNGPRKWKTTRLPLSSFVSARRPETMLI